MKKQFTFRGMDHSKPLEDHANQQLAKIEHFLEHERTPISMHLVLDASMTHRDNAVELSIKSPNYDLFIEQKGPDLYKVLDEVIDVMYRKLHEKKKELQDKRHSGLDKTVMHELEEGDEE